MKRNQPVLDSRVISSTGGVRDPHILRCEDGKTFYMVVTDMVSGNGWSSNRYTILLKSKDLVTLDFQYREYPEKYPNQEDLKTCGLHKLFMIGKRGKYMVYWSMQHGNRPDIIYYAYADKDFTDIEGETEATVSSGKQKSCIDATLFTKMDSIICSAKRKEWKWN